MDLGVDGVEGYSPKKYQALKKYYGIGLLVSALSGLASAIPPENLGPGIDPPVAEPSPAKANPFLDSLAVSLTAADGTTIWYDYTESPDPVDPASGSSYHYDGLPIPVKTNLTIHASAYSTVTDIFSPGTANFKYVKDVPPLVAMTAPAANQALRQGTAVVLSANALDDDGPAPLGVNFYRSQTTGAWALIGTGTANGNGYSFSWALDGTIPLGATTIRATAADGKGATASSDVAVRILGPNQAPTVSLDKPVQGTVYPVPNAFTVSATASDVEDGIAKVEFYENNLLLGFKTAAPYTWDRTGLAEGSYSYKAIAFDNGSPQLSTTSGISTVTVRNKLPKVTITNPLKNKSYNAPFSEAVMASVVDTDGTISKVEFYRGATLDTTLTLAPYNYTKGYPAGSYSLTAKAYDNSGGTTVSEAIPFTVAANLKPTAKAGPDTNIVLPNSSVKLDKGTSVDPEGTPLHYKWTGPGVTFSPSDTAQFPTVQVPAGTTGSYGVTLKVMDSGTPQLTSDNDTLIVFVYSHPTITTPLNASGTAKSAFSYALAASGYPIPGLSMTGAPAWLTLTQGTPGNATLSGTPPATGNFNVNLIATSQGGTDTKVLAISIGDSLMKPAITSPVSATAKAGTAFTYTITASGNPSNFTYAATGLPTGLSIAGAVISGTPAATALGPFTVGLTVTNSQGSDAKNLALTVNADPKILTDLPDSQVVSDKGKASFTVTAAAAYPALSYQWQYCAASATGTYGNVGTNSPVYSIDPVSLGSVGWYRVVVKNGGTDATSKACHLKVTALPAPVKIILGSGPIAQSALVGATVQFRTMATGEPAPLYYQWFKGNTPLGGGVPVKDDSVLTLTNVQQGQGGVYRAIVTNSTKDTLQAANFAKSDTARLTVQLPKLTKPAANVPSGTYDNQVKVVLSHTTPGVSIYITVTGADPTQASTLYHPGDTLLFKVTATLKAKAYYDNVYRASDVLTETYSVTIPGTVNKPTIKPVAPTFQTTILCTLSTTPADAALSYTLDGKSPTGATAIPYSGPFAISATTTVNAIGKKTGMIDSDTLQMTYTLVKPKGKVLAPQITPNGGTFSGTAKVTLFCPTEDAVMFYTLDGTAPDSGSTRYTAGAQILIGKSATLSVIATKADNENSPTTAAIFKLIPGAITAVPAPDIIFDTAITVTLSATPPEAIIHFTQDGTAATKDSPVFPGPGVTLRNTTTLSAVSVLAGVTSNTYSFSYTKKGGVLATPTPYSDSGQFTFSQSINISLLSTPNSDIYYTLDGSLPNRFSSKYLKAIPLDSTTTLQAFAVQKGYDDSKILVATYTLVPEKPIASPVSGGYPSPLYVHLKCSSKKAELYYTLDGKDPVPGNRYLYDRKDSILIPFSGSFKSVAVAGNMSSPIAEENYRLIQTLDTSIAPKGTLYLDGGYTLKNPESEKAIARLRIAKSDPLHLVGFANVQYAMTLSLDNIESNTGLDFPNLIFTAPASDKRSLYKIEPSGSVYFITAADTVTLSQPGTYFMGVDTLPPVIAHLSEIFGPGDSTRVVFHVTDNVANLNYTMKRNDDSTRNLRDQFLFSGQDLPAVLKHPAGTLKPLYIQLIVSDYQQATFFPMDPQTMLSLSQRLTPMQGPQAWKIGAYSKSLYDFIGIPLSLDPILTLKDLRVANPGLAIEGAEFNTSTGKFQGMDATASLKKGQGFWVGAHGPLRSLVLPRATTLPSILPGENGGFSVYLHHGWNQISNPHLEEMYWPFSRLLKDAYKTFPIKSLWAWDATLPTPDYREAESLLPWRGYFVYNNLGDTTVKLSPRPLVQGAGFGKFGAVAKVQLSLGWGAGTLRLGADWTSSDAVDMEDETALPGRGGMTLNALREGHSLVTDWIHMERDGIQQWQVAMGSAGDSLPPLRIGEQELPEGFEAWAISPSRGMKFLLEPGHEVPASGLAEDTLTIVSGPREKLARLGLLRNLAVAAPNLDLKVAATPDGFRMAVGLPARARIHAVLWSISGDRLGELVLGPLSGGSYRFDFAGDFRGRPARLSPGMYFLSLEVKGQGVNARLARKVVLGR